VDHPLSKKDRSNLDWSPSKKKTQRRCSHGIVERKGDSDFRERGDRRFLRRNSLLACQKKSSFCLREEKKRLVEKKRTSNVRLKRSRKRTFPCLKSAKWEKVHPLEFGVDGWKQMGEKKRREIKRGRKKAYSLYSEKEGGSVEADA